MLSSELNYPDFHYSHVPFQFYLTSRFLPEESSISLLNWFETEAPWRLVEKEFYQQYEFSLFDTYLPTSICHLVGEPFLRMVRETLERIFTVRLDSRVSVVAHKLIAGQAIRVHNDFIPGQETTRLVIQINRGWQHSDGGYLMIFNSDQASDICRVFPPHHQSTVAFRISPNSHHAVSTVHRGERYTLVFSFYDELT